MAFSSSGIKNSWSFSMFCLSFIWRSLPNGPLLFWVKNLGQAHLRIEQTAPWSHGYLSFPVGLIEYMVHTPFICYRYFIGFSSCGNYCSLCCPLPNVRVFLWNFNAQISVPTPDVSWTQPWVHKSRIFPDIKIPCDASFCLDHVKSVVCFIKKATNKKSSVVPGILEMSAYLWL